MLSREAPSRQFNSANSESVLYNVALLRARTCILLVVEVEPPKSAHERSA